MNTVQQLLARPPLTFELPQLRDKCVLVTGSEGSVGQVLCRLIGALGAQVVPYDSARATEGLEPRPVEDVLDPDHLAAIAWEHQPDVIFHLAAHKYATLGEDMAAEIAELNVRGTANVRHVAQELSAFMVLASTCKAADPCTAYGATKLLAEREALRYEGTRVLRLVNVLGSVGSVLQIWANADPEDPLPIVNGVKRMWMSEEEAAGALLATLGEPAGLYAPRVPPPEYVRGLLTRAFPGRASKLIPLRRGDRPVERLVGEYEQWKPTGHGDLIRIVGPWGK